MKRGALISGTAHIALILAAVVNLPWLRERSAPPLAVTDVTFITANEFEAAAESAPAPLAAVPAPPARPAPQPRQTEVANAPPPAPQPQPQPEDVATLVTPPEAGAPDQTEADTPPSASTLLTAPRPPSRPAERIAQAPVPPPAAEAREADEAAPEVFEGAEAEIVVEEQPAAAPPEAAPDAPPDAREDEPAPPVVAEAPSRALEQSSPPLQRRGNLAQRVAAAPVPEPVRAPEPVKAPEPAPPPEPEREPEPEVVTPPAPQAPPTPAPPAQVAQPAPAASPSEAPGATATAASGPPMTAGEKDGLKFAIQQCWNVPAGLRDAQELRITVAAELDATGEVLQGSVRMIEPTAPPDGRYDAAYRAARSALIRCGPYSDLPQDKYAQWRQIEVVFNPEGMVSW